MSELQQVAFYATPFFYKQRIDPQAILTIEEIIEVVCEVVGITEKALTSQCRKTHKVRARHYIGYIARKYTALTLAEIGQRLGRRDHTTVIHGTQTIGHRIKHEPACYDEFATICRRLRVRVADFGL